MTHIQAEMCRNPALIRHHLRPTLSKINPYTGAATMLARGGITVRYEAMSMSMPNFGSLIRIGIVGEVQLNRIEELRDVSAAETNKICQYKKKIKKKRNWPSSKIQRPSFIEIGQNFLMSKKDFR